MVNLEGILYFSELHHIDDPASHDWFDPILEQDTLLFVDPFLLFRDEDPHWREAHAKIIEHFDKTFLMLARCGMNPDSQLYRRAIVRMQAPEPQEFRLGYTSQRGASGAGSGIGIATKIIEAMCEATRRGIENLTHFEELGILEGNIERDRISDLTCNLLKPEFIRYTQTTCADLEIEMLPIEVPHGIYDKFRNRWIAETYRLPVAQDGKSIILVPKRFLRELPTINARSWISGSDIRDDFNLEISTRVKKEEIIEIARRNLESVREWVASKEGTVPDPYDVDRDPALHVRWQFEAREVVARNALAVPENMTTEEDILEFVKLCVENFRHWVENLGGWRVFWRDVSRSETIPEPSMQLLFMGIVMGYCELANIRVDREVETGRGPVDFTFTGDHGARVLLEIKKLTNGKFWNGLRTQLPIYMRNQTVDTGMYMVVRDSDTKSMNKRWPIILEDADKISAASSMKVSARIINILPKKSASKADDDLFGDIFDNLEG